MDTVQHYILDCLIFEESPSGENNRRQHRPKQPNISSPWLKSSLSSTIFLERPFLSRAFSFQILFSRNYRSFWWQGWPPVTFSGQPTLEQGEIEGAIRYCGYVSRDKTAHLAGTLGFWNLPVLSYDHSVLSIIISYLKLINILSNICYTQVLHIKSVAEKNKSISNYSDR